MDFQTQCRLHGYKFNVPERPVASTTYRDLYRDTAPQVFHSARVKGKVNFLYASSLREYELGEVMFIVILLCVFVFLFRI